MSDPRPPDDGSLWPERDLDPGRDEDLPDASVPPDSDRPIDEGFRPDAAFPEEPSAPASDDWSPRWFDPQPAGDEPGFSDTPSAEPETREPEPMPEPEVDTEPEPMPEPEVDAEPEREPEPEATAEPAAESRDTSWTWLDAPEPGQAYEPDPTAAAPPDEPEPEPIATSAAPPVTTFGDDGDDGGDGGDGDGWDPRAQGERRRPTTAEQAVPWLIGIILALTGIVIVLVALIFTSPDGLAGLGPGESSEPTPVPSLGSSSGAPSLVPSGAPSESVAPTAIPTAAPTATPAPTYGPLEMAFLGRQSAAAPVYLLRRDFSTADEATVMTQAADGITRYAWAPDGTVGAAIIDSRLVSVTPGESARSLADNVSAVTFGWDAETVYAVRILRDGANDRADILEIDFVSGGTKTLSSVTYPHPVISADPALREAQFIDDGGTVRIYAVADGNLTAWILGAPAVYQVDPGDGSQTEVSREPILWSPDGTHRITLAEGGSSTVLGYRNRSGDAETSVRVTGLVSHVRWAGTSNEIVFTLGYLTSAGGVRQDLYVWDLVDGKAPLPLTSNGTSFGAEWLGVMPNWLP